VTTAALPACKSVTHIHLLAALRAELGRMREGAVVRVLDAGCGDASLIGYLHGALQVLEPELRVEVFGFDVSDPGVQKPAFLERAVRELRAVDAAVDWDARVRSVSASDPWPFAAGSFDVVISNQVLEHVADHARFFGEHYRVLHPGGVGLHCFPVRECIWEGHLHMPGVHWIRGHELRTAAIRRWTRLGFGKFRAHRRQTGISLDEFAARHADFVNLYTNYLSAREMLRVLKACRLRASFRYTTGLLLHKLCSVVGARYRSKYPAASGGVLATCAFWFLKRLSSITLRVEKLDAYRNHYS
jgi:SAM-dependent methyltransferase